MDETDSAPEEAGAENYLGTDEEGESLTLIQTQSGAACYSLKLMYILYSVIDISIYPVSVDG